MVYIVRCSNFTWDKLKQGISIEPIIALLYSYHSATAPEMGMNAPLISYDTAHSYNIINTLIAIGSTHQLRPYYFIHISITTPIASALKKIYCSV
jgi:hypothetical protein